MLLTFVVVFFIEVDSFHSITTSIKVAEEICPVYRHPGPREEHLYLAKPEFKATFEKLKYDVLHV